MKRLYLFSMLIMLFVSTAALASPRTFSQAKAIAERKAALLGIKIDKKAAAKAPSMNGGTTTAVSPYYVFPFGENKGFAIVSGDDDMPEIVGYADHGTYDANNMPAAMAAFLNNYRATIEAMKQGNASAIKNIAEAKALRANNTRATTAVSPLLGDIKWNQSEPYNNMCPKYDGTNLSATGCVATAMAQVMMYWKYPKELKADINEYKTYTHKLPVAGELKGQKYDWDNMLPTYTNNNYTQIQADAVAKLMLHCGKAVEMDYGEESGAIVTPGRLAKYFGYDSDLMLDLMRSCFTLAEWTAIIDKELQAKRPILYSGQTTAGGHQFVCDGSDGNGLYHINWGWGGYQDGYFDITILNPGQGGIGAGNVTDGYNRGCNMIIGIQPDNGKVDEPLADVPSLIIEYYNSDEFTSGIELTKATRNNTTEDFTIKINDCWDNIYSTNIECLCGYGISDGKGGFKLISETENILMNGTRFGTILTINNRFSPNGTYTIYAIYSTDNGKTWKKCAYYYMQPYVVKSTATTLSLVKTQLTAEITSKETQYSGVEGTFELSITNNGDDEFIGLINAYTSSTATCPDDAIAQPYMTIPAHSTVTREIGITPTAVGDMYVWIEDGESGEMLQNAKKFNVEQSTAPSFVLEKVETNATPDAYELENARHNNYIVKAPRVDDDKAEFTYYIKNNGGTASVKCWTIAINAETNRGPYTERTIKFPGNGSITTISYSYTPEQVGSNTMYGDIRLFNTETAERINITSKIPNITYYLLNNGIEVGSYKMAAIYPLVYIAGKPNAISGVTDSASSYVLGGTSEITIFTEKAERLPIFRIDGSKVCDVITEANTAKHVTVAPGLYIVRGKKIVVK
ncbi:C10 family peptidase [uncultured Prevotella sp.]|uniref:C10 family peptidase n=1 Tax=uncultured Prevotella sp. TaxID=159272 RepID=UPI0025CBE4B3|nr:C10 family peptidase [uncultured Prevotella sp.]